MEKKYELLKTDITKDTITNEPSRCIDEGGEGNVSYLYRLRATKSFGKVKKGELGGLVESGNNLSHGGNCWVDYDSALLNDAKVLENGKVEGGSILYNGIIYGNAIISNHSRIYGHSRITSNATVSNSTIVDSKVNGNSRVYDCQLIKSCILKDSCRVSDTSAQNMILSNNGIIEKSIIVNCDFSERKSIRIISGSLFHINTLLYVELDEYDLSIYPSFNINTYNGLIASSQTIRDIATIPVDRLTDFHIDELQGDVISRLNNAIQNHKTRWFMEMCNSKTKCVC